MIYAYIYVRANATHMVSVSSVCVFVRLRVSLCLCAEQAQWKWMLGHVHLQPTSDLQSWDLEEHECMQDPRTVKSGETLVPARSDTDVQIVRYTFGYRKRKTNRTISQLVPSAVSLRITKTEQLYQAKWMIEGIGNVPCSTYSQTLNACKTLKRFFGWTSEARDNPNMDHSW